METTIHADNRTIDSDNVDFWPQQAFVEIDGPALVLGVSLV
jgi:hypothetical protein